jgi:hypothetical protein
MGQLFIPVHKIVQIAQANNTDNTVYVQQGKWVSSLLYVYTR